MIAEFIDGLQNFHFLQNALITAVVIGIVAGAVGCFIILRGMSLDVGDDDRGKQSKDDSTNKEVNS